MINNTILFSKNKNGKLLSWEIFSDDSTIFIIAGQIDGAKTEHSEEVDEGLASRTLKEQVLSRINSRINKQLDKGYVYSLEDAKSGIKTNALGYKRSAKCHRWDKHSHKFPFKITYVQPKLNGHHATVINDNGTNVMYSNGGKIIDTMPELVKSLKIPVGRLVEGELYKHGLPLQTISSYVRKKQKGTDELKFIVYDYDSNSEYKHRYIDIENIVSLTNHPRIEIIKCDVVYGKFNIKPVMRKSLKDGYEGLVVRDGSSKHTDGTGSDLMLKVKCSHLGDEFSIDDEFLVVDIKPSKDNWAILVCIAENGKTFKVNCHGTVNYKISVFKNKEKYIGKHIRINFSGYSKSKIPLEPIAEDWREKFDE